MQRALAIVVAAASIAGFTSPVAAQTPDEDKPKKTVLTFYGLLKLEQDPEVSDEKKLEEWQAFIDRAAEQTVYAKKAVDRWKNAAKVRLVDAARKADGDPKLDAPEKLAKWAEVARLYPRSKEGRRARQRVTHWRRMETNRLVDAAEAVEKARRPKVERIQAWAKVVDWVSKGSEARAAQRRINQLQEQLFTEARSADSIARVDARTKLAAWKDVLAGRPNPKQRRLAESRVAALEAKLAKQDASARADGPGSN